MMEPQEGKLPAYEEQTIGLLCVQEIITLLSLDTATLVFVRTADVTLVNKQSSCYWGCSCFVLSCFSSVRLSATLQTVAHQAPLSVGFSRLEYWSGLPFPPPRDLPNPEIVPLSLMSPALTGGFFTTSPTWEATKPSKRPEKIAWVCLRGRDE